MEDINLLPSCNANIGLSWLATGGTMNCVSTKLLHLWWNWVLEWRVSYGHKIPTQVYVGGGLENVPRQNPNSLQRVKSDIPGNVDLRRSWPAAGIEASSPSGTQWAQSRRVSLLTHLETSPATREQAHHVTPFILFITSICALLSPFREYGSLKRVHLNLECNHTGIL